MAGWAAYISSKAPSPSAWRDRYTTPMCCQLWHLEQTWKLAKRANSKLVTAQTKMERIMLDITHKGRRTNVWVREKTQVKAIRQEMANRAVERNNLAEEGARKANLDAACRGLRPITGHYSCPMMIINRLEMAMHYNEQSRCCTNFFMQNTDKQYCQLYSGSVNSRNRITKSSYFTRFYPFFQSRLNNLSYTHL